MLLGNVLRTFHGKNKVTDFDEIFVKKELCSVFYIFENISDDFISYDIETDKYIIGKNSNVKTLSWQKVKEIINEDVILNAFCYIYGIEDRKKAKAKKKELKDKINNLEISSSKKADLILRHKVSIMFTGFNNSRMRSHKIDFMDEKIKVHFHLTKYANDYKKQIKKMSDLGWVLDDLVYGLNLEELREKYGFSFDYKKAHLETTFIFKKKSENVDLIEFAEKK